MKTLLFLLLMLAGGFGFWWYNSNQDQLPRISDSSERLHIVVKGDTLSSLSRAYHTDVASIKERNKLNSDTIVVGQKLYIIKGKSHSVEPILVKPNKPTRPTPTPPARVVSKEQLPKSTVMETRSIAIDINDKNQVYLKNDKGQFVHAGQIIYGSDSDASGREVKTVTFVERNGRETSLPGDADPEAVIRLALKAKR